MLHNGSPSPTAHTLGLRAGTPPKPYRSLEPGPTGLRAGTPPRPYRPLDSEDCGHSCSQAEAPRPSAAQASHSDLAHDIVREAAARELALKVRHQSEALKALGAPRARLADRLEYSEQMSAPRATSNSPHCQDYQELMWSDRSEYLSSSQQPGRAITQIESAALARSNTQSPPARRSISPTAQGIRQQLLGHSERSSPNTATPSPTVTASATVTVTAGPAAPVAEGFREPADVIQDLQNQLAQEQALRATLVTQAEAQSGELEAEVRRLKAAAPRQLQSEMNAVRATLDAELAECRGMLAAEQSARRAVENEYEESRRQHEASLEKLYEEHREARTLERDAREAAEAEVQRLVFLSAAMQSECSSGADDGQLLGEDRHYVDRTAQLLNRGHQTSSERLAESHASSRELYQQDQTEHSCQMCFAELGAERDASHSGRFVCDLCDQGVESGCGFRSCRRCDFDVCVQCLSQSKSREMHANELPNDSSRGHTQARVCNVEHPGALSLHQGSSQIPIAQQRCGPAYPGLGLPLGGITSSALFNSPHCSPRAY